MLPLPWDLCGIERIISDAGKCFQGKFNSILILKFMNRADFLKLAKTGFKGLRPPSGNAYKSSPFS